MLLSKLLLTPARGKLNYPIFRVEVLLGQSFCTFTLPRCVEIGLNPQSLIESPFLIKFSNHFRRKTQKCHS